MLSKTNPIVYACVAKGTVALAEWSCGDQSIETLGLQCLQKAPQYHRHYTHTARERMYSFLIEDPFVYFAIYSEKLGQSHGFRFLNHVNDAFLKYLKNRKISHLSDLSSLPLHEEFSTTFQSLMQLQPSETEMAERPPLEVAAKGDQAGSSESSVACKNANLSSSEIPLLGKPHKHEKFSKSLSGDGLPDTFLPGDKSDLTVVETVSRERGLSTQKSGCSRNGRQIQARKIWRQHVQIVLFIDLVVCCVLLGIWLSICKGFHCLDH